MTGTPEVPGPRGGPEPPGAGLPLDEQDFRLLEHLRRIADAVDPMPPDLVARVRFAVEARNLDEEVSRLVAADLAVAEVRGEDEEGSRTVTFDSETMTVMVRISGGRTPGTLRLDGWLAPAASHPVCVRAPCGELTVTADEQGRFVFDDVPHGLAQLVVRPVPGGPDGAGRPVTTPAIML